MNTLVADRVEIGRFVHALFRYAETDTCIRLCAFDQFDSKRPPVAIEHIHVNGDLSRIADDAAAFADKHMGGTRPIVFCPPICTLSSATSAKSSDVANGLVISVEIDDGDTAAKREQLEGVLGPVTAVVASGSDWTDQDTGEVHPKVHLHWRLNEPTQTADDHIRLRHTRELAARLVGADPTGKPVVHPLRWPGTWNCKGKPRQAKLLVLNEAAEIGLDEAIDKLGDAIELAGWAKAELPQSGDPQAPLELLQSAMAVIPNDDVHYDEWIRFGYACYRAAGGSDDARDLWDSWSKKSGKFNAMEQDAAWKRIAHAINGSAAPRTIGAGTIFFQAAKAGWIRAKQGSESTAASEPVDASKPDADPAIAEKISAIAWASLDIKPDIRLLGDFITSSTRAFLVGSTGLGKTLLAYAMVGGMATGRGFLHWTCDRPSRWLIIDGEMPAALVKSRAADMIRRAGDHAIPPHGVLIYSRDRAEEFAKAFPSLGQMQPLNTEQGHNFVNSLIAAIGGIDGVAFDNVMSLVPGDQKDEEIWAGCIPLVESLSRRGIAQLWCDHTGHNTGRQYGSNTKSWRFDCVGIMTPLSETDRPTDHVAFQLSFDSPGKARRRTPGNWQDFAPHIIRLVDDVWNSEPVGGPKASLVEDRLSDKPAVLLREIKKAIAIGGRMQIPEEGASEAMSVARSSVRSRLIAAGWYAEPLLCTALDGAIELKRAGYSTENNALTTLKRNNLIGFNRFLVWLT